MLMAHALFVSTILEKIKEMCLKCSQGSVTVSLNMSNYEEERVKLTNTSLKLNQNLQQ